MPVEQYRAALEFLQKNPDVAKQHIQQAHSMMGNPSFAASMAQVKRNMTDPAYQQKLNGLKEDAELKSIFEEIEKGGQEALAKYVGVDIWFFFLFWGDQVVARLDVLRRSGPHSDE